VSEDRRAQMTRDVLAAIRLGEDTGCDFKAVHIQGKQVFERNDDVADDLAALANGRGGRLILGVEDKTRQVQGIALGDLDRIEQVLREIARDKIDPMVHIETWRLEVPDTAGILKPVLVVDVPKSLFVHRSPGGYRKRFGASQRALKADELLRLMQQRNQSRSVGFDELTVSANHGRQIWTCAACRALRPRSERRGRSSQSCG
jgi:ATP-dependent DNA helicase RecG